jgi:hypothetical protein
MAYSQWLPWQRIHTNRAEWSPIQSSQTHKDTAVTLWPTHSGCRGSAHTNRAELSPIQSSQTHKDAAVTLWLTHSGCRSSAYTPTEPSRVQSSPVRLTKMQQWLYGLLTVAAVAAHTYRQSRVQSYESCRVKCLDAACSIFVSQTLVVGRDGSRKKWNWKILVKDHEAIFDASRCELWSQDYIASVWLKIAQEMGVGKWSTSVFYFLLRWWRYS